MNPQANFHFFFVLTHGNEDEHDSPRMEMKEAAGRGDLGRPNNSNRKQMQQQQQPRRLSGEEKSQEKETAWERRAAVGEMAG